MPTIPKTSKTTKTALTQAADPRNRKRTPKPKDRLEGARKVTFERVKVRTATGVSEVTRLRAYLDKLHRAGLEGDIVAIQELRELAKYLEKRGILVEPLVRSKSSSDMDKRISDHQKVAKISRRFAAISYASLCDKLHTDYVEKHGREPDFQFQVPYWLDLEACEQARQELQKSKQKRPTGSEVVGYKKPPTATRWKAKQSGNPSGKRKERGDGWDEFRSVRARPVAVQTAGRRKMMHSDTVITKRVYDLAATGDKDARRLVRQTLIELDQRNMLTPVRPKSRRRRVREALAEKIKPTIGSVLDLAKLCLLEHMEDTVSRVYGPSPTFREDIARARAPALERLRAATATIREHA